MDKVSKEKRSEIMSRVKSKNTSPEKLVFSYLRRNGIYFQRHYANAPGSPDIALPSKKRAVFIDGGFWHGYRFRALKPRLSPYWKRKIKSNMKRDRKILGKLKSMGWKCIRIWDHELQKKSELSLKEISRFLTKK